VDLGDDAAVARAFASARPEVVLHAAALARVADCQRDPERARRINAEGPATLARLADSSGALLVHISTDLVFEGTRGHYTEDDPTAPLSVYGRTKAEGEAAALAARRAVVVRLSLLYGPSLVGRPSFFDEQAAALRGGRAVTLFADEWRSPLDLATAAAALVALARSERVGLLHLGGPERLSRWEMGQKLAAALGTGTAGLVAGLREQAPAPEPRPRDCSLDSTRWRRLFPHLPWPTFDEAVRRMLQ
jgi:dTDP-4-dehydrorhamnose reductase